MTKIATTDRRALAPRPKPVAPPAAMEVEVSTHVENPGALGQVVVSQVQFFSNGCPQITFRLDLYGLAALHRAIGDGLTDMKSTRLGV